MQIRIEKNQGNPLIGCSEASPSPKTKFGREGMVGV